MQSTTEQGREEHSKVEESRASQSKEKHRKAEHLRKFEVTSSLASVSQWYRTAEIARPKLNDD